MGILYVGKQARGMCKEAGKGCCKEHEDDNGWKRE